MTTRQLHLFGFIKARILAAGISPTHAEMREHMKVASNQAIQDLLAGIEEDGYITRKKGRLRGIVLTAKGKDLSLTPSTRPTILGPKAHIQTYNPFTTNTTGSAAVLTNTQLQSGGYKLSKGGVMSGSS